MYATGMPASPLCILLPLPRRQSSADGQRKYQCRTRSAIEPFSARDKHADQKCMTAPSGWQKEQSIAAHAFHSHPAVYSIIKRSLLPDQSPERATGHRQQVIGSRSDRRFVLERGKQSSRLRLVQEIRTQALLKSERKRDSRIIITPLANA